MTGETDNLADAGTESVETSQTDNPETWDYYDPDDDQDTVETLEAEGNEDEAAETETDDEAGEADEAADNADPDDDEGDTPPITATKDAVVELADGQTATVGELIAGHMRQQDYSRKTAEVAELRKASTADVERIQRINNAFVNHLAQMVPAEPDPALAYSDPQSFQKQKAQYDATMGIIQNLIAVGDQAKEVSQGISEEDNRQQLLNMQRELVMMFPEAGTKDGHKVFYDGVQEAAESVGFTTDDLNGVTDSRLFALAHWAKKGMAADKAKKTAKAKIDKAAPTAPRKPSKGNATGRSKNADAMRKLSKSGSLQDALAVDFD